MRHPEAAAADLPTAPAHLAKEKARDDEGGVAAGRRTAGPPETAGHLMQESAMGPAWLARRASLLAVAASLGDDEAAGRLAGRSGDRTGGGGWGRTEWGEREVLSGISKRKAKALLGWVGAS